MANTNRLERFLAVPTDEGAELTIEVEGQNPIIARVTLEQIEDMLDTLDEILDVSDEDDEDESEELEEN